ncbi:histidine phosphatase family protein [Methylosinus sp. Sm6]|nr:histidine phosphatase family protein [Methylosinus sp. Sm6]
MILLLLCHASTNAQRTAAFPLDEPIDATGHASATALGGAFSSMRAIVCSPARRALETAAAAGLTARPEPALRDCDYGRWAGGKLTDIARGEPAAVEQWLTDPEAAPHGGESIAALLRRVAEWMDDDALVGPALAITHASVIRAAVVHAIGASANAFWRIDASPLSAVELRRNERRWSFHASRPPPRTFEERELASSRCG